MVTLSGMWHWASDYKTIVHMFINCNLKLWPLSNNLRQEYLLI